MNLIKLFKTGRAYMKICSTDKQLVYSFPEIKIILYLKFAIKYLPPLIVALFLWQYYLKIGMVSAVITALFAISIVIQGIIWLGKRALSPLPLNLLPWYLETQQKLIEAGILPAKPIEKDKMTLMAFMQLYDLANHYLNNDDDINDIK